MEVLKLNSIWNSDNICSHQCHLLREGSRCGAHGGNNRTHVDTRASKSRCGAITSLALSHYRSRSCVIAERTETIYIYLQAAVGDAADADSLFILITLLPSAPRRLKDRPNGNEFCNERKHDLLQFALGVLKQSAEWRNSCILSLATRLPKQCHATGKLLQFL